MTQSSPSTNPRPARIFDLDGTLVDSRWRSQYEEENCADDKVVEWVLDELVAAQARSEAILIVTNRREERLQPTLDWLANNDIHFDELKFRKTGDTRYGAEVKRTAVEELIAEGYRILGAYEDKWRIVDMYVAMGISVTAVDLEQDHLTKIYERSNGAIFAACPCGWESGDTSDTHLNKLCLQMEANDHEELHSS